MSIRTRNSVCKSFDQEIGKRIRNARIVQGLNQGQLGALIGVSAQQMQKYERGINSLSVSRLLEIADVLHVPFFYLLDAKGQKEPLNRKYLQLIRNSKMLEAGEPEVFLVVCKMVAEFAKSLKKRTL